MATARQNPLLIGPAGVPGRQGPPGGPGLTGPTGPAGSSSGSATLTSSYTQPAHGLTVVAAVSSASSAAVGNTATVGGTQKYTITNVSGSNVTLLNDTLTNSTSGTIAINSVVVFGGPALPNLVAPRFVTDLANTQPTATRARVDVDGYAAVGDGGHGRFHWDNTYSTAADALHIYVTGIGTGAWVREIGADNVVLAAWFGAKGDNVTDDTAALQAMLDYNNVFSQPATTIAQYTCKLNKTAYQNPLTAISYPRTMYQTSMPLIINDISAPFVGNTTQVLVGDPGASGIYAAKFQGPALVVGLAGTHGPLLILDPSGSGETLCQAGQSVPAHVAAGSNGYVLTSASFTLNVDSTAAFSPVGHLSIASAIPGAGWSEITYTGKTSTTFTGCQVVNSLYFTLATSMLVTPYTFYVPQWNFSEYSTGDLTGLTNFTFEYYINPCDSTAWANSVQPGGFISSVFGCGGAVGSVLSHTTLNMEQSNVASFGGVMYYYFQLTTVNTQQSVQTSLRYDHTPPPNALTHVAFSYDGANLRMFINGNQSLNNLPITTTSVAAGSNGQTLPQATIFANTSGWASTGAFTVGGATVSYTGVTGTTFTGCTNLGPGTPTLATGNPISTADAGMTVAITGALDQRWYETLGYNLGSNTSFPVMGGNGNLYKAPPGSLLGKCRFSLNARYTAPFTAPVPSTIVCDSNTRMYIDFTAGNVPTRPGLAAYTIAHSGNSRYGTMTGYPNGFPIWLQTWTQSVPYTNSARVRDLFFVSAGRGIQLQSSLNSEVGENCTFGFCEQGIVFDSFSYNSGVGRNCTSIGSGGHGQDNFLCAEFIFGVGSQFSYLSRGWSSQSGSSGWAVICSSNDLMVEPGFPLYYKQGVFCFTQNADAIHLNGVSCLDDQATGYLVGGVLMAPTDDFGGNLTWSGGYVSLENTTAPMFILGSSGTCVSVHNSQFNGVPGYPLFSFQGHAATRHTPIIFSGPTMYPVAGLNLTANPLVDPAFPGRVIVPQQEMAGTNVLNFAADADQLVSFNAFAFGRVRSTDTGVLLTTTRNVLLPTAADGWTRIFINSTAKTLHYIAANGTWAASVAKTISNVTYSPGSGLYIVTATAHGMATGATVTVASVAFTGTAAAPNGTGIKITVIDANSFYFYVAPGGTFTYTSGGTATQTVTVGTLWAAKTPNDRSFLCTAITTGQTGGSEPTWNTTVGVTTTDGGVTWTCHGTGVSATAGNRVTTLSDGTNWT